MAESKGIRRFLELVLDRASARRTETEAQAALNKSTDPKKAQQNLTAVDRAFDGIGKTVKRLGAAIVAAFAFNRIKDFAVSSVKEFAEAEAVWSRLGVTLGTVGLTMEDVQGQLDKVVTAMGRVSTMGDEDVANSLQTLVQLSGDYSGSLQRLHLVADLSAESGKDFAASAELVGKAMAGNTALLIRQYPQLKNSKDILTDLGKLLEGQALKQRGTWAGSVKVLSDEWANFKEAVGKAITEAGGGTSVIESLTGAVRGLTIWLGEHQPEIDAFAKSIAAIVDALKNLPRYWENLKAGRRMLEDDPTLRLPAMQANPPGSRIGGITVTVPRILPVAPPTDEELKAVEDHIRALWAHLGKFIAENQQAAGGIPLAGVLDRFAGLSEEGKRKMEEDAARLREFVARGGRLTPVDVPASGEVVDVEALQNEMALLENLGNVASQVADGITDSFRRAFGIMRDEGATVGNFLEGVFRGIAGSALAGIGEWAQGKVKENIAAAIEAGAYALGLTAVGKWDSAGEAGAAAVGHIAAATAWGALAGGAGAAGNAAIGRGGHGSGLSSRRDAGSEIARGADRIGAEINIYINPLDPSNPAYQRNIAEVSQFARERHGDDSRITVRPFPMAGA